MLNIVSRRRVAMVDRVQGVVIRDLRFTSGQRELSSIAVYGCMAVMLCSPLSVARSGGMVLGSAEVRCYGHRVARHEDAIHVPLPWVAPTHDDNLLLGEHAVLGIIVNGLLQMIHGS